ncbi:MAG: hypothetical protein NUV51_11715 [Sulfuricaulis sp.]|nr:hypothetical protein [Sulfuricaulis sp.]
MTPVLWVVAMLVTVSTIYLGAAVAYHYALRPGMALAFVGYVIANLGLIIDAIGGGK